jgi:hypothetical protein
VELKVLRIAGLQAYFGCMEKFTILDDVLALLYLRKAKSHYEKYLPGETPPGMLFIHLKCIEIHLLC